jgi:hypothetical protein
MRPKKRLSEKMIKYKRKFGTGFSGNETYLCKSQRHGTAFSTPQKCILVGSGLGTVSQK